MKRIFLRFAFYVAVVLCSFLLFESVLREPILKRFGLYDKNEDSNTGVHIRPSIVPGQIEGLPKNNKVLPNKIGVPIKDNLVPTIDLNMDNVVVVIGVMTVGKYLGTRACGIVQSWGKPSDADPQVRIVFFVGEDADLSDIPCHLPEIVRLKGVKDRVYPPLKKSFMMQRYFLQNFSSKSSWLMRADDDLYIRTDRLVEYISKLDSDDKPLYIGRRGYGVLEERPLLQLEEGQTFCMGGPGILFSRQLVADLDPFIDDCLKKDFLVTSHEDVEVGRCIYKKIKVDCKMQYGFHQSYRDDNVILTGIYYYDGPENLAREAKLMRDIDELLPKNKISFHPVKEPKNMLIIHQKELTHRGLSMHLNESN